MIIKTFINLLFLLSSANSLAEILHKNNDRKALVTFSSSENTVILLKANVVEYSVDKKEMKKTEDYTKNIILEIRKDSDNKLVFKDKKPLIDPSFFYTTSASGAYVAIFYLDKTESDLKNDEENEVSKINEAIEVQVFVGRQKSPDIISPGDVELDKADEMIKNVIKIVNMFNTGNQDNFDDETSIYENYLIIVYKSICLVIIKIISYFAIFMWSSLHTKNILIKEKFNE